jgi:hypothetical protein
MAKHYVTISDVQQLATRLAKGTNVDPADYPHLQNDLLLAAAVLRRLIRPATEWTID